MAHDKSWRRSNNHPTSSTKLFSILPTNNLNKLANINLNSQNIQYCSAYLKQVARTAARLVNNNINTLRAQKFSLQTCINKWDQAANKIDLSKMTFKDIQTISDALSSLFSTNEQLGKQLSACDEQQSELNIKYPKQIYSRILPSKVDLKNLSTNIVADSFLPVNLAYLFSSMTNIAKHQYSADLGIGISQLMKQMQKIIQTTKTQDIKFTVTNLQNLQDNIGKLSKIKEVPQTIKDLANQLKEIAKTNERAMLAQQNPKEEKTKAHLSNTSQNWRSGNTSKHPKAYTQNFRRKPRKHPSDLTKSWRRQEVQKTTSDSPPL